MSNARPHQIGMDTGTRPDHSAIYIALGSGREIVIAMSVARRAETGEIEHDAPTVEEIQDAGQSLNLLAFHTQTSL